MSLVYDILALSSNSNMNCAHITGLNNLALFTLKVTPSLPPFSFPPFLLSFHLFFLF